ncbi:MAG TPA: aminoglycoside phosphotransferase family protein [Actinomycetota bacterium]|nr:aminoglycoside phosphotransferase family protein [Actinomycetota bacterium]
MEELSRRWSLTLGSPFDGPEVSAAWVSPALRADGGAAVLKISMPHFEGDHEAAGLRFWNGRPTVRLLDEDPRSGALLLERCEPGTWLRAVPEEEQDVVIAGLLRVLWRAPGAGHPFRPLSTMVREWIEETEQNEPSWPDRQLVRDGLRMFEELAEDREGDVLLATDLHAGNVLRARRSPWLVIDPKPFVGDPSYDATQHLLNCEARMRAAPLPTIDRFARLLGVDADRVRRWMFARAAAENRDDWHDDEWSAIARRLAP